MGYGQQERQGHIYCGKGRETGGRYGTFYQMYLVLDDIPDEFVRVGANGKRCPHDATVTRYIRYYNEKGGSIECISRSRSTYKKTADTKVADHEEEPEDPDHYPVENIGFDNTGEV